MSRATPAAIAVLRQATAIAPLRMKASDGLLPSKAHRLQSPNSDHNTGYAVDLTHDKLAGIDCGILYNLLRTDKRVKYLIFNGRIFSKEKGDNVYTGSNKHTKHLHISIQPDSGNDTSPWFPFLPKPKTINKIKAVLKPLPKKEGNLMTISLNTWLDRLPAVVRHALIMSAGILLSWGSAKVTVLPAPLPELAALIIGMGTLYVTKLTKQYGIGKG